MQIYAFTNSFSISSRDFPLVSGTILSITKKPIKANAATVPTTKATKHLRRFGKRMFFGTFLDCDGNFIDTVHFPPIAMKYPFRGQGVYRITGKVIEEFDCINIEVISMKKLAVIEDPRYSDKHKTLAI